MRLAVLLLAAAAARAPLTAARPDQVLAALNRAWAGAGDGAFVRGEQAGRPGLIACSGASLCVDMDVAGGAVRTLSLVGDMGTAERSRLYLRAQAMLVALTAPGAPYRPVVTADRLAVDDGEAADAQLGPICLRVTPKPAARLDSSFSRSRCTP